MDELLKRISELVAEGEEEESVELVREALNKGSRL
jgi:methanogenic corrinoid protein MtbC1